MRVIEKENLAGVLRDLFSRASQKVVVVSAWIRGSIFKELLSLLGEGVELEVVVRAGSLSDMDVTDAVFFKETKARGGRIYLNPRLHSKFLVVDEKYAVLGSSNITFMGLYPEGNLETNVLIEEPDRVEELLRVYESIRAESLDYTGTLGFVLQSGPKECEVLLLEEVKEQTYLSLPFVGGLFLGRLKSLTSLKELKEEALRKVLSSDSYDWKVASLFAGLYENPELLRGRVEILGEYERERNLFKTPLRAPSPGTFVKELSPQEEDLERILLKNHSGYDMAVPLYVGKLYGTEVKAFLDLDKVIPMHMAVIGATGSGKTTFVKKILKGFPREVEVFVLDIYGEYGELEEQRETRFLNLPNVLLPLSVEDVKELLKEGGSTLEERSSEEKEFFSVFRRALKPDLRKTELLTRNLLQLYEEALSHLHSRLLKEEARGVLENLMRTYGEEAFLRQPEALKGLVNLLESPESLKILNFKEVDITETKVNLAGLLLKEVFILAKKNPRDRVVVIEEAQNIAPERGFGEVATGRENLAFTFARKIATEGRKLRLGMIAITQRPAGISKFILSQLNTQVVFKLITRNDLEAVSPFFEHTKEDLFRLLPFLKPGTAFLSGLGVPFSFLFRMEEIPYY